MRQWVIIALKILGYLVLLLSNDALAKEVKELVNVTVLAAQDGDIDKEELKKIIAAAKDVIVEMI